MKKENLYLIHGEDYLRHIEEKLELFWMANVLMCYIKDRADADSYLRLAYRMPRTEVNLYHDAVFAARYAQAQQTDPLRLLGLRLWGNHHRHRACARGDRLPGADAVCQVL